MAEKSGSIFNTSVEGFSLLTFLKEIAAIFATVTSISYALGFLIVSTNLRQYGIADISFLSPRYFSVGFCFLVLLSCTIFPVFWAFQYVLEAFVKKVFGKILGDEEPSALEKVLGFKDTSWMAIYLLIVFIFFDFWLVLFLIQLGSVNSFGAAIEFYRQQLTSPQSMLSLFWILLPGWFLAVLVLGLIWAMQEYFQALPQRFKNLREASRIYVVSKGIVEHYGLKLEKDGISILKNSSFRAMMRGLSMVGFVLIPIVLILILLTYSENIYPRMNPAVGGGRPSCVRFVVKQDDFQTMKALVPINNIGVTDPVKLFVEGENYYVALSKPQNVTKAIFVQKKLIQGFMVDRQDEKICDSIGIK